MAVERAHGALEHLPQPAPLPGIRDLLAALDDPAVLTGEAHEIRAYNGRAASLLGMVESAMGMPLTDFIASRAREEDGDLVEQVRKHLEGDGETTFTVRMRLGDTSLLGTWNVLPVGGVFRLHRLYLREQDTLDSSRVDFLANVSHELRTPLSALVATTELLLQHYQTIPPEELGAMIGYLHRNTRRLDAHVSNLIDAAALLNGRLQLRRVPTNPHSLIRDASDFVQPLLQIKNQKLDMRLIGQVPALVVDSKRIVGVLTNLLSNAIRYGPSGEPVQLLVSGEGTLVRFTVRQRGTGIPKQEQALLFQRFYRASTGETVQGGSGLGLAIVKEIVEMHGGEVGLLSKPGSTAFWFTLPVDARVEGARA